MTWLDRIRDWAIVSVIAAIIMIPIGYAFAVWLFFGMGG